MIVFRLPFPPSVNALYLHVATANGGVKRVASRKHEKWGRAAQKEIMAQRVGQGRVHGAYRIILTFGKPQDSRRRDLGNLEKCVSDQLVHMGILRDDSDAQEIVLRWGNVEGCLVEIEDWCCAESANVLLDENSGAVARPLARLP